MSFTAVPGSEFKLVLNMLLFAELKAQAYCEAFPVQLISCITLTDP